MKQKTFYFDVETTGLDPSRNSIIELSGLIEIDGEIKETLEILMRPRKDDPISEQALKIQGRTKEQILEWPMRHEAWGKIKAAFERHVNPYDREDKFTIAGQNVQFDLNFLVAFWEEMGDKYLGSFLNFKDKIDTLPVLNFLQHFGIVEMTDAKLGTACKYFGIEIEAHNALSDIKATRILAQKLVKLIRENIPDGFEQEGE